MFTVGIIPAAGQAQRFGGVPKELLPSKDGVSFLRHAVNRLPTDLKIVVTRPEKLALHAQEVPEAVFMLQQGTEIWGAIQTALSVRADRYYFTMPDTYVSDGVFEKERSEDFVLGLFKTKMPQRFGVLVDGKVVDKTNTLIPLPAKAWGVLEWSWAVAAYWQSMKPTTYTEAINLAIETFGLHTFDFGYYFDNASLRDYQAYIMGEG